MNGKAIAAALGILASIATIVSLVVQLSQSSHPEQSQPGQTSAATGASQPGPASLTEPASPTGSTYPGGSVYTAAASAVYMGNCEQQNSPALCQCTLTWFKANVAYPQFVQDMALEQQYEQNQAANPPDDVVKAYLSCG